MRRIFTWTILLPAAVAVLVFALNNRQGVAIDLWPFGIVVEMPVYLAFLVLLGIGALIGGIVSKLAGGAARASYRTVKYELEVKSRELEKINSKCQSLEAEIAEIKQTSRPGRVMLEKTGT